MSTATILLVDDDEVLRQVLRRVLTRDGYEVIEAGGVAEALERARQQRPALALIDLRLPDGDGVEVAEQLSKEIGRFPFLLMTAYPLRLRDQPELARAFAKVLTKPLNLDELREAIASSLGKVVEDTSLIMPVSKEQRETPSEEAKRSPVAAAPPPVATPPKPRRRLKWIVIGAAVAAVVAVAVAFPALGRTALQHFLHPPNAIPVAAKKTESYARLVANNDQAIELPPEAIERLAVVTQPVETAVAPRPLEMAGSLSFDPNTLGQVRTRFAGEVVALGTIHGHASSDYPDEPILRYGHKVTKGQLLAVVLSKDLGEKKSELVDSLIRLWYDESMLEKFEELVQKGIVPIGTVMNQRTLVGQDRNALFRAELTLRTWRVTAAEIEAIKEEAKSVYEMRTERNLKKEMEWAKVEVRAPYDGIIVEKSVAPKTLVGVDFDLFKVADLRKLGVIVHAYEEDLNELNQLQRGFSWRIRAGASGSLLKNDGIAQVGLIVDPTQHTAPVMGLIYNDDGQLRVGQFVKATVDLPAPPNVVSVPPSAVWEDGEESIVFVQPDPAQARFVRRRVSVAMRLRDAIYIRSELDERERNKGRHGLTPGEYIVAEGVLELQSALEDLQAKAKRSSQ
jgi:cobalt-zinc-cadmium efflux system membrane fusion protein